MRGDHLSRLTSLPWSSNVIQRGMLQCKNMLFVARTADKGITPAMTYAAKFCRGLWACFLDWITVLLMTVTFNFKGDSPTAAGSVQTKKKPTSFGQAKLLKAEWFMSQRPVSPAFVTAFRSSASWHLAWLRFDLLDHLKSAPLPHLNFISP